MNVSVRVSVCSWMFIFAYLCRLVMCARVVSIIKSVENDVHFLGVKPQRKTLSVLPSTKKLTCQAPNCSSFYLEVKVGEGHDEAGGQEDPKGQPRCRRDVVYLQPAQAN